MIITLLSFALAGDLEPSVKLGLKETVKLLNSRERREAFILKNQKAKAADAQVRGVVGTGANTDATYALAADVFAHMVEQTGGEEAKLNAILQEANRNPEAFYKKFFSDSEQSRLRDLAAKLNNSKP